MSLPRSLAAESFPNRPCSTIVSSRLSSVASAAGAACAALASAIGPSIGAELRAQLLHLVFVAQGRLQNVVELLVALQRAAQVGQLVAQVEQLLERLHLPRHSVGREVIQALEREIDAEFPGIRILAQLVLH